MKWGVLMVLLFVFSSAPAQTPDTCFTVNPIPDSIFTRMQGRSYKKGCPIRREELRYLRLSHHDANGKTRVGEIICNKAIAQDLTDIFRELWKAGYRIERMELIDQYDGDDQRSMEANNTSCFNYRTIAGSTKISKHGKGMAIDINPLYNPYVKGNRVEPKNGRKWAFRRGQRKDIPYKIDHSDLCYKLFHKYGFQWGGDWRYSKDYQHFER